MQRLRIKFSRGDEIKFISHLDIMRLWERTFKRAGIKLALSEGFNPRPRLSLAAPLAVGVTSRAELMDIVLTDTVTPHWFMAACAQQLPPGIEILSVFQVGLTIPSLQSHLRFAEYQLQLDDGRGAEEVESSVAELLATETIPWFHQRDTGRRDYDLRPLIDDIQFVGLEGNCYNISMRLRCDNKGSGRPEQVALALGFESHPHLIHRTRLVLQV